MFGASRALSGAAARGGATSRVLITLVLSLIGVGIASAQETLGADVPELVKASAAAETVYVSPTGAGDRSGRNEANAMAFSTARDRMSSLSSSTVFAFVPGVYSLTSGTALRAPSSGVLHLRGGDGVVFRGDFSYSRPESSSAGLRLRSGNVIVEGIRFENTRNCVRAENNATLRNVYIKDVTAKDVHSCINIDRGLSGPIENWTVSGLEVDGYYRVGVRLGGPNARGFNLSGLQLNGANSAGVDYCWKGGIQLYEGVSNVRLANARIVNNIGDCTDYQQGDGIEADDTGGAPRNIEILNTYVGNSGDADLDMKANGVRMYNVVSAGGRGTYYNFKFWNYPDYSCEACVGANPNWFHIILVNATARFTDAQFYADRTVPPCDLRHRSGGRSQLILDQVWMEATEQQFRGCESSAGGVTLGEIPADQRQVDLRPVAPEPPVLRSVN